jgi:hypothetical protein
MSDSGYLISGNTQPPGYTPWFLAYAALATATQALAGFVNHRRSRAILAAVA